MEFFNPVVTLGIFVFLTVGLPFAWCAGGLDVRLAERLFKLHRRFREARVAKGKREHTPEYFRLPVKMEITPWGTAKMAFEPYSLSLSVGVIAWSVSIGISPGGAPITATSAALAMGVALASMAATLVVTWIVPPLWLLRTAGVRVLERDEGEVSRVDEWYNAVLGPVMGVAALGTLFVVYAIGGLGLRPAVFSFVTISVALFPINFAATYLYRVRREARAASDLAVRLRARGVKKFGTLGEALGTGALESRR